jgi:hypothetical protein
LIYWHSSSTLGFFALPLVWEYGPLSRAIHNM